MPSARWGALLCALLLCSMLLAAEETPAGGRRYASNEIGLRLRELGPAGGEESDYLLVVSRRGAVEISRLYLRGEEIKRWEASAAEEKLFVGGILAEKRLFDGAGRLTEEHSYRSPGGEPLLRVIYRYTESGLQAAETYDGEGKLLYTDRYRVSPQGRLLEVRRLPGNEGEQERRLSFKSWEGKITEELTSRGAEEYLYRYDGQGRALEKEVWRDGEPVSREHYRYAGEPPASGAEDVPPGGVSKLLDAEGRVVKQVLVVDGRTVEEFITYDEAGRKVRLVRSGPAGLEETEYAYTDSGRLSREETRRRGQLRQITFYQEDGLRVSEFYREGELFLRVTYRNDRPLLEEIIQEGRVVRTREPGQ